MLCGMGAYRTPVQYSVAVRCSAVCAIDSCEYLHIAHIINYTLTTLFQASASAISWLSLHVLGSDGVRSLQGSRCVLEYGTLRYVCLAICLIALMLMVAVFSFFWPLAIFFCPSELPCANNRFG